MEALLTGAALGAITGIILALTGAGGTIIAVPLLMAGLNLAITEAAPIALFAVCLSASFAALIAHRREQVRYRAAGFIALTGILAAPSGILLAQHLPNAPLTVLFALILFYVAFSMLRQNMYKENAVTDCAAIPCQLGYDKGRLMWNWPCARALGWAGIAAGFLSGLLGVGGGFVVVPALKKATNLPIQSILATSLAVIALIAAVSVVSAALLGSMNWTIALPFAAGALAGALAGRLLAYYLAGPILQQGFAVVSMGVSVWMIVRLFWAA